MRNDITGLNLVPSINEENAKGRFTYDVFSRVLKDRIIYITGEFNTQMFEIVSAQLLYLDTLNNDDITLIINSPGGEVYSLLAIVDVMKSLKSKVNTVCYGMAASCAAILFTQATGKRYIGENSYIMIHSVSSGTQGKLVNQEEALEETKRLNEQVFKLMTYNVDQNVINKYKERKYSDSWIDAKTAVEEGIADEIIINNFKR